MNITATLVNIYHICHRELWLHTHGIRMEHTSDTVAEGKQIGENTYGQRAERWTEIEIRGSKIDFYDAKLKIVHEVKKSDRLAHAYVAQVKFYIWLLEQEGITGAKGILEYPKQRCTEGVELTDEDRALIPNWIADIQNIIENEVCPKVIDKPVCKNCAYCEFCYAGE